MAAQHAGPQSVADSSVADPSVVDPSGADPSVADPSNANPSIASRSISPEVSRLQRDLTSILAQDRSPSATWGVLVVSLDSGDTLFARNAVLPLAPASNMKLLTTAAALHYLGPDYRYSTFLLADGPVVDGVLEGDLILYGTGDPALSDRFFPTGTRVFEKLADELADQGIHRVAGNVIGDGSFFEGPLLGPEWDAEDLNDWFAAPTSALSFNENTVRLHIEPASREGEPPVVHTIPEGTPVAISNQARTVSRTTGVGLAIRRSSPEEPIAVVGEVHRGGRDLWRVMTVPDPPLFAATVLMRVLGERGIEVDGRPRGVDAVDDSRLGMRELWAPHFGAGGPSLLATHRSPPMLELLRVVNVESHNLYAELVLKTLGHVVMGDGSFQGGVRAVRQYLTTEVGVSADRFDQRDGSGLSPANRVSPSTFVDLLSYLARSDQWEPLWDVLPQAGVRRGLRRMYGTRAARNLRAKTGTIEDVSALTGAVKSRNGEWLLFSILSNDIRSTRTAKRIEDRIGARLAEFQRPFVANELLAARTPRDPAQPRNRHRVRAGESFSEIALRYGVPLARLLEANPGIPVRGLQPGQVLEIPASDGS